jgi:hypothetical protein
MACSGTALLYLRTLIQLFKPFTSSSSYGSTAQLGPGLPFSHLLRHAWVIVRLFFILATTRDKPLTYKSENMSVSVTVLKEFTLKCFSASCRGSFVDLYENCILTFCHLCFSKSVLLFKDTANFSASFFASAKPLTLYHSVAAVVLLVSVTSTCKYTCSFCTNLFFLFIFF